MMPLNVYKSMKFDYEIYKEAIEAVRNAAAEADQADARLRDLHCRECADTKVGSRWFTIREICKTLDAMADTLETATCDECGALMAAHGEECEVKEGE